MLFHIHQTHNTIADFESILTELEDTLKNGEKGLHIFPELFLCGYPLQDLCLQKSFIDSYQNMMERVDALAKKSKKTGTKILAGGIKYDLTEEGLPLSLRNSIFLIEPGKKAQAIYSKQLLPNYDIFDEMKYFTAGKESGLLEIDGKLLGIMICEDMWSSNFHDKDPVADLKKKVDADKLKLDAIINLSASPFVVNKQKKRLERARNISNLFEAPFIYVNRVGGEDEILFDGNSFVVEGGKTALSLQSFQADNASYELNSKAKYADGGEALRENTWEELFRAKISQDNPTILELNEAECEEILQALCFGFQEYAAKSGFDRFTVALSGGIDSALVLAVLRLSLKEGQYLEAIYMPSIHSSPLSHECCLDLCEKLGVPFKSLPIKFLHSTAKNLFSTTFTQAFEGLTDENIQSRLRGTLLYTRSNQIGSMVVNTSNKSELAVGYSTQYGDSVGAISLLGDLYKTEVYALSRHINKTRNGIIPDKIIERAPSAELRPGQEDTQSLPPYERLDAILEGILTYRYSMKDLLNLDLPKEEVIKTFDLYRKSEFKRRQFCPIIKISSKSFGFGYRIPISKASGFYLEE